MQGFIFQDAMTSSTRVFGRKDVSVVFAGDNPRTDGGTVYLPALAANAEVTSHQGDVIRGYRSHEALHVRITDTSTPVLQRLGAIEKADPRTKKIVDFCEDIRIEKAGCIEYPGMRQDLSAVNAHAADVLKEQVQKFAEGAQLPVEQLLAAAPPHVQLDIAMPAIGRQMNGLDLGWYEEAIKHIRPDILAFAKKAAEMASALPLGIEASGALNEAKSKAGTIEAMDLGERIAADFLAMLAEPPPPPAPQPEPEPEDGDDGEGEQPGDGEPGDGDGQGGDGSDGDADAEGGDGSGDAEGEGGGDQAGEGEGEGQPGEGGGDSQGGSAQGESSEGEGSKSNPAVTSAPAKAGGTGAGGNGMVNDQAAADAAEAAAKQIEAGGFSDALKDVVDDINGVETKADDGYGEPILPWRQASSQATRQVTAAERVKQMNRSRVDFIATFDTLRQGIGGKQAMIRRILEQELQARFDRRWQGGFTSGKLNAGRLTDAVLGKESVYRQRQDGKDIDTLLHMHVDASGSMGHGPGTKMGAATQLAIAMCDALERTGCEIAVSTWTQAHADNAHQKLAEAAQQVVLSHRFVDHERGDYNTPPDWRPTYTSTGDCLITHFKTAQERMSHPSTKERFGFMSYSAGGGTPLIDGMLPVVAHMAKQKHGKRILIVMTDGDPNGVEEGSEKSIDRAMVDLHESCRKHGIHLIGVGIFHPVGKLFSDAVQVNSPESYGEVMKRVAKHLKQERTSAYRMQV